MFKWFGAFLDRGFVVIGAAIFVQAPLFMQQYTQQLIGREAELRMQVEAMRRAAGLTGKTLTQYIQKFLESSDPDFMHQGAIIQGMSARWQHISDALYALQHTTLIERPFVFLTHLNRDVLSSTIHNYTFGLPLTIEAGVYAIIGMGVGYAVFAFLCSLIRIVRIKTI